MEAPVLEKKIGYSYNEMNLKPGEKWNEKRDFVSVIGSFSNRVHIGRRVQAAAQGDR